MNINELLKEALKLADQLNGLNSCEPVIIKACETMIRRLVAKVDITERDYNFMKDLALAYEKRIEELEKLEQDFIRVIKQTNPNKPQTKPLSDEEIMKEWEKTHRIGGVK